MQQRGSFKVKLHQKMCSLVPMDINAFLLQESGVLQGETTPEDVLLGADGHKFMKGTSR